MGRRATAAALVTVLVALLIAAVYATAHRGGAKANFGAATPSTPTSLRPAWLAPGYVTAPMRYDARRGDYVVDALVWPISVVLINGGSVPVYKMRQKCTLAVDTLAGITGFAGIKVGAGPYVWNPYVDATNISIVNMAGNAIPMSMSDWVQTAGAQAGSNGTLGVVTGRGYVLDMRTRLARLTLYDGVNDYSSIANSGIYTDVSAGVRAAHCVSEINRGYFTDDPRHPIARVRIQNPQDRRSTTRAWLRIDMNSLGTKVVVSDRERWPQNGPLRIDFGNGSYTTTPNGRYTYTAQGQLEVETWEVVESGRPGYHAPEVYLGSSALRGYMVVVDAWNLIMAFYK